MHTDQVRAALANAEADLDAKFESQLKRSTRNLAITVAVFLGLLVLHACLSCTPVLTEGPAERILGSHITGASVVTILRKVPADPSACSSSGGCLDQFEPAGNAFAVHRAGQDVRLITAAHCLFRQPVGGKVRYLAPNGVGHDTATVVSTDVMGDVAELVPDNPRALVPLRIGDEPEPGDFVVAVSSFYGEARVGVYWGALTDGPQGWSELHMTIVRGWSGSPVTGPDGRVFAFLSKCPGFEVSARPDDLECKPERAFVVRVAP